MSTLRERQIARLSINIRRSIAAAASRPSALPVRQIAWQVIQESGADPALYELAVSVASEIALQQGRAIEFSA